MDFAFCVGLSHGEQHLEALIHLQLEFGLLSLFGKLDALLWPLAWQYQLQELADDQLPKQQGQLVEGFISYPFTEID